MARKPRSCRSSRCPGVPERQTPLQNVEEAHVLARRNVDQAILVDRQGHDCHLLHAWPPMRPGASHVSLRPLS
eukprot:9068544-Alexandrium_andersonii.AAC.1